MEKHGKQYIYLWFSSGDIILVDGLTFKQLSHLKLENDVQLNSLLSLNPSEAADIYLLAGLSQGTLLVLSGPSSSDEEQAASIKLVKKLKIPGMDADIGSMIVTSRGDRQGLVEVAVCSEDGLRFVGVRFAQLGRQIHFSLTENDSETYLLAGKSVKGIIEYQPDMFALVVDTYSSILIYDRYKEKIITIIKNPTGMSEFSDLRHLQTKDSSLLFLRDRQYLSVLDLKSMKCYKLFKIPFDNAFLSG